MAEPHRVRPPRLVLTHQAWPDGPNRSTVHCDLYVEADKADTIDVSGAVDFWDITNREDYHVVEMQQQGTQSRVLEGWPLLQPGGERPRVRHHGRGPLRERRLATPSAAGGTETAAERRLVTRKLGPAQKAEFEEAEAARSANGANGEG